MDKSIIESGKTALGIEFGSTRIKSVLVDESGNTIATGGYSWENQLSDGIWTYSLESIYKGLASCYKDLKKDVMEKYGVTLKKTGSIGISAMMHGYLAFDKNGSLLHPFKTWRNTDTGEAAEKLTELFDFNIPLRWSIAHLYQEICNNENYVNDIDFITTLAGMIHWNLTGEKVVGIGDGAGMFPVDSSICDYDKYMLHKFDDCIYEKNYSWKLKDILPKILVAGESAGYLTEAGAKLLDEDGDLESGILMCPPEGDAGTGMVATNSVEPLTGNVSAGTSVFAMVVLDKPLSSMHKEIDMVTTPSGEPVAMVHCNNCTSDINGWSQVFSGFAKCLGMDVSIGKLFETMFKAAMDGDDDCSDIISYNYYSGEPVTGVEEGRPMVLRRPDSNFTFENFMKSQLYSAIASLKYGMNILLNDEGVKVKRLLGHGGYFKTENVGNRIMAAAMNAPVTVMPTAGEGGAWGIAVLALFAKSTCSSKLHDYLNKVIFKDNVGITVLPDDKQVNSFDNYMKKYIEALPVEKDAGKLM